MMIISSTKDKNINDTIYNVLLETEGPSLDSAQSTENS